MANITVDESHLEELIEKVVKKHLKVNLDDDVEEVRRSPAAAIVRLETRLEAMEKIMATKSDVATLSERSGRVEASNKLIIAFASFRRRHCGYYQNGFLSIEKHSLAFLLFSLYNASANFEK